MKDIIAIINQKGGVGKSTTAYALGAGLDQRGYSVLFIDLDAQGNLSYSMDALNKPLTSLEVLTGTATAREATTGTYWDIIPASGNLAGADTLITETGKEYRLKEALEPIKKMYDYIIIDTPPALGVLTINALTACKSVIIPTQADIYSLQGIGQLSQTLETVKKYCNKNLKVKGILATRYNARANLTKDMITLLQDTADQLHTKLYNTKIRECIALKEAQAMRMDIFTYAKNSNASEDYNAFIEEYLSK
jgi:chromosome partitioning protein